MSHVARPYTHQVNIPADRNNPAAAETAVELHFPETFCKRAWKVIIYFDGAMYLYRYKDRFVVTDESLDLTEFGDGSPEAPLGAPRWTGDSLEDLEQWLLQIADEYDDDGHIPGWEA